MKGDFLVSEEWDIFHRMLQWTRSRNCYDRAYIFNIKDKEYCTKRGKWIINK